MVSTGGERLQSSIMVDHDMNDNSSAEPVVPAVVFDWAGTLVDFGSLGPVAPFRSVFADEGVEITYEEARGPMGLAKREHIAALTQEPRIEAAWTSAKGRPPRDVDIDRMYDRFIPRQVNAIQDHATPIPGVPAVLAALRRRGIRVGACTGYNRPMLKALEEAAREQGLHADCSICADDVPAGRPAPDMAFKVLQNLGVTHPNRCIKVDDTTPGIGEGLAAGMWTIGVTVSGNEVGLSQRDWSALPDAEQTRLREAAERKHWAAGAHHVIDSVAELMPCLDAIARRLENGERP